MNHQKTKSISLRCVALLACLGGSALAQEGERERDDEPHFPGLQLGKTERGAGIIGALGHRLPEVAKAYGLSENELGKLCLRDKDIRADKNARLLYACAGAPIALGTTATDGATDALLTYPASQTFTLHSKPGKTRVIYLDFDGHTTSGTSWNAGFIAGAAFTSPAYDTESTPTTFSTTELANIQEIWKRVSEDYAPWDVDVTTQEPALESLRKTTTTDTAYGIRVVIGGSSATWFGGAAGGVAYVGSYSWNSDTPAYVFPAELGNGVPKYVAEAISHETGHTVGLNHDGTTTGTEYYSGANNWAPIMGASYYATVTQFSKGEYASANNLQDDLAVIDTYVPRSLDLVGNDILTALPLTGTTISVTGIVETALDADLYKLNAGAGVLTFTASGATPESDLDLALSLYDSVGNIITTVNPSGPGATLSYTVAAGTYYLAVEGGGLASVFTDYASLGQFKLTGTIPSILGLPPVAVVSQSTPIKGIAPLVVNFSSAGSNDPEGLALRYDWDFGDGTRATTANPQHTYTATGNYLASLVVIDASGLSASAALTITVQAGTSIIYVSNIALTQTINKTTATATAVVTIKDANGSLTPNANVTGAWSGLTTGTSTMKTNSSGQATFTSSSKNSGTFTFTVTGVTASGTTYDATRNAKTSTSLVR
jgi:PKD repeat protein